MLEEINVARGIFKCNRIEEDFYLLFHKNDTEGEQLLRHRAGRRFLQFHFCVTGEVELIFNGGHYRREVPKEKSTILYNPQVDLPIEMMVKPKTSVVSLLIPIADLHALFSKEAHFIAFLNKENRDKKYYQEHPISPIMMPVLSQIINRDPSPIVADLYYRAKALEVLSLYFNGPQDIDLDQCPFLADEKNVAKIKLAKEIMIQRMTEPPTLQELAEEIQLPLNRLKKGFKQVYGDTVYGFLLEYKMEQGRQLLIEGSMNVNEVGLKLGYSAASHFIAAFKRKYGTTPKKYLMAQSSSSL